MTGRGAVRLVWVALLGLAAAGCAGHTPSPTPTPAPQPLYLKLTRADARTADVVLQRALETLASGATASWSDPAGNAFGAVTPIRTFRTKSGLYCREFEESISIEGAVDRYRLIGCRFPDRVWRPAVSPADRAAIVAAGG